MWCQLVTLTSSRSVLIQTRRFVYYYYYYYYYILTPISCLAMWSSYVTLWGKPVFTNAGRKTLISVHLWSDISICQLLYAHPLLIGPLRRAIGPLRETGGSPLNGSSACSPVGLPWEYPIGGQNPIGPLASLRTVRRSPSCGQCNSTCLGGFWACTAATLLWFVPWDLGFI